VNYRKKTRSFLVSRNPFAINLIDWNRIPDGIILHSKIFLIIDDTIEISDKMAAIFKFMKIKDSDQIIIDEIHRLKYHDKSKPNPVNV